MTAATTIDVITSSPLPLFQETARTDLDYWNSVPLVKYSTVDAAKSATELTRESVRSKLRRLLACATDELYEDGMETDFLCGLTGLLKECGDEAVDSLAQFVTSYGMNEEVAAESLRCLTLIEQDVFYNKRLWLLERSLYSQSARIRDAASLGVASFDDPHAIPYLSGAISLETVAELRQDMELVLRQLENTHQCP